MEIKDEKYDLNPIYLGYEAEECEINDKKGNLDSMREYHSRQYDAGTYKTVYKHSFLLTENTIDSIIKSINKQVCLTEEEISSLKRKAFLEKEGLCETDEEIDEDHDRYHMAYYKYESDDFIRLPFESEGAQEILTELFIRQEILSEMMDLMTLINDKIPNILKNDLDFNIKHISWNSNYDEHCYQYNVRLSIDTDLDILPFIKDDLTKFIDEHSYTKENRQQLMKQKYDERIQKYDLEQKEREQTEAIEREEREQIEAIEREEQDLEDIEQNLER